MTDYIKREDAIAEFATNGSATVYGIDKCKAIISRLKLVPSADVVEVVRCKDCIHKMEDNYSDGNVPDLICKEWDSGVDAYDYCSYGERREA